MTALTQKASLGEQWRLVQELLDEAELERLGAMTPAQGGTMPPFARRPTPTRRRAVNY